MVDSSDFGAHGTVVVYPQFVRTERSAVRDGRDGGNTCNHVDSRTLEEQSCGGVGGGGKRFLFPAADLCGADACVWAGGCRLLKRFYGGCVGNHVHTGKRDHYLFFTAIHGDMRYFVQDFMRQIYDVPDRGDGFVIALDNGMAVYGNQ